jgi:DNA-directed RNA polymerase specialized sigma24 family protein
MTGAEYRSAFEEHKDAIHRFAWRMARAPDIAEDMVQDVFLALLRQPERFGSTNRLSTSRWRGGGPESSLSAASTPDRLH